MIATQSLPLNYQPSGKFDLKNMKLIVLMNVAGLIILIFSLWIFSLLLTHIRPEINNSFSFQVSSLSTIVISIAKLLFTIIVVMLLHEGFHAYFFWLFSRHKPIIGFKGAYAYASLPGWYLPRNQYLLIVIAPLIFITLIGVILFVFMPASIVNLVFVALVINTSGAVGDLFVVIWLLTKPTATYALDQIDTIEFFVPTENSIH
ncbi:MAG TPA: DUF3267 domain-containing protein [Anaerolineaceae bacterium]|nr:DUF3267 domain-containing protein [Anaerolineaceae bacterium]